MRKLYHEAKDDEKIGYVDYTSLYPYINKYGVYPTGHPEVLTEDFKCLSQKPYFGLIKVCLLFSVQSATTKEIVPPCTAQQNWRETSVLSVSYMWCAQNP